MNKRLALLLALCLVFSFALRCEEELPVGRVGRRVGQQVPEHHFQKRGVDAAGKIALRQP